MIVSTYSIVACDLDAAQWGVAVQSKFLAVGSVVPWAEPEVGAIATQAYANPRYGPDGLALLREGLSAEEVVSDSSLRTTAGTSASSASSTRRGTRRRYTGSECLDWAGRRTGACYAAQGNILVGAETVDALATTFEATAGTDLAARLLECLAAAQLAGGDRRGQQSAALLIVERNGGVRAADRHRGRSARRRPSAADRGAAPAPHDALPPLRHDSARELAPARGRSPGRGGGAARAARLRARSKPGRASRTSRNASTGATRSIRSSSRRSGTPRSRGSSLATRGEFHDGSAVRAPGTGSPVVLAHGPQLVAR